MEAPEDQVTTQKLYILKGKRTKRQRVQSPTAFALTTTDSSTGDGGSSGDYVNNNNDLFQDYNTTTQEEEDMANCLILLAQGQSLASSPPPPPTNQQQQQNDVTAADIIGSGNKFNSSRRFLETAADSGGSPGSGKVGYSVYECKTCSRTFPSFQALGGHRASHKKPSLKPSMNYNGEGNEEPSYYKNVPSLSLQIMNIADNNKGTCNYNYHHHNKSKIHECSVCGAKFTSGQALGGHMRRHRAPAPVGGSSGGTGWSLTPLAAAEMELEETQKERKLLSLDLDLNLPAPVDDKLVHFVSSNQQQQKKSSQIVFSSPALVDCHY